MNSLREDGLVDLITLQILNFYSSKESLSNFLYAHILTYVIITSIIINFYLKKDKMKFYFKFLGNKLTDDFITIILTLTLFIDREKIDEVSNKVIDYLNLICIFYKIRFTLINLSIGSSIILSEGISELINLSQVQNHKRIWLTMIQTNFIHLLLIELFQKIKNFKDWRNFHFTLLFTLTLNLHLNQVSKLDFIGLIRNLLEYYQIIIYWAILLIISLITFELIDRKFKPAKIIKRKFFHLLALFIFIPAMMRMNSDILLFISITMIYLFILIEKIRNKFWKYSMITKLNEYLINNIDGRDDKNFLLTHIFLLFACFSSLLYKEIKGLNEGFSYYSLIVLGVGDSLASIVGSKYGKTKIYPPTKKSLEGTFAALVGSYLALCFCRWEFIGIKEFLFIGIVFLYEGFTLEIDNLVLPIFTNKLMSSLY